MVKIKGQHIHVDICVNGRALESYLDKRLEMNNKYPDHAHRECWEDYYREDSQAIFANPDGQDPERRPRRINKYRYVQARSEQQYTFEIHWGPRFPFKDDSVYIRIYVDDQFADGFHVNKSKLAKRKGHTERRVTAYYKDNGISVKPDLFFTNLKIRKYWSVPLCIKQTLIP